MLGSLRLDDGLEFVAQLVSRESRRRARRGQSRREYIDHRLDAVPMPPVGTVRQWCERFAEAADHRDAATLNAVADEVSAWRSPAEAWDKRPTLDLVEAGLSQELASMLVSDVGLPRVEHVVDTILQRRKQLAARGLTRTQLKEVREALERLRKQSCANWDIQQLPDVEYVPTDHPAGADEVRRWTRRFGCLARDNAHPSAIQRLVREVLNWTPDTTPWEDRPAWDLSVSDGGTLLESTVTRLTEDLECDSVLDVLEFLNGTPPENMKRSESDRCPHWSHAEIEAAIRRHYKRVQAELAGAAKLAAGAATCAGSGTYEPPPAAALTTAGATCAGVGTYTPPERRNEAA